MKNFNKIERYLNGEMKPDEKKLFEDSLSKDSALAEEVQLQSFEEDAINLMLEDELLEKIKGIRKKKNEPSGIKKKGIFNIRWFQIAVAASIVLVAGYFIKVNSISNIAPREIALNYYAEYGPNFSSTKGINSPEREPALKVLAQKNIQKIDEAINYYSQENNADGLYKLGHAYFIKKDYKRAIESFKAYLKKYPATERNFPAAEFYLILSYLGNDEIATAKTSLKQVQTDKNHSFATLFKKLDKELFTIK